MKLLRLFQDSCEGHQCKKSTVDQRFARFLAISPLRGLPQIWTSEGKNRKTRFWRDGMPKRLARTTVRATELCMHGFHGFLWAQTCSWIRKHLYHARVAPVLAAKLTGEGEVRCVFAAFLSQQVLLSCTVEHGTCLRTISTVLQSPLRRKIVQVRVNYPPVPPTVPARNRKKVS